MRPSRSAPTTRRRRRGAGAVRRGGLRVRAARRRRRRARLPPQGAGRRWTSWSARSTTSAAAAPPSTPRSSRGCWPAVPPRRDRPCAALPTRSAGLQRDGDGAKNATIAPGRSSLSERSVEKHINSVFGKLGLLDEQRRRTAGSRPCLPSSRRPLAPPRSTKSVPALASGAIRTTTGHGRSCRVGAGRGAPPPAFRIGPYNEMVPAARQYRPGRRVVDTTWQTRTGCLRVRGEPSTSWTCPTVDHSPGPVTRASGVVVPGVCPREVRRRCEPRSDGSRFDAWRQSSTSPDWSSASVPRRPWTGSTSRSDRRGAWLPRPERGRQVHHDPGAARPAARRRRRPCGCSAATRGATRPSCTAGSPTCPAT